MRFLIRCLSDPNTPVELVIHVILFIVLMGGFMVSPVLVGYGIAKLMGAAG